MKTIITKDEILFKRFFYTLVLPKKSIINFDLIDARDTVGLPLFLYVESNNLKVTTIVGTLFYYLNKILIFLALIKQFPFSPLQLQSVWKYNSPTQVSFIKNIEPFLNELNEKGYNVEDVIRKLKLLIVKPIPEELTPGTSKWKKDKLLLVFIVYIFFIVISLSFLITNSKVTIEDIGTFVLFAFILFIFCVVLYRVLSRVNK